LGLGKYTEKSFTKLAGLKKIEKSVSDFESDNVLLGMASGLFTEDGNKSILTDLEAMKIYTIDHEEEEYSVTPIRKISEQDKKSFKDVFSNRSGQSENEEEASRKDTRKLIRREFKVVDTGEEKTINGFECNKYTLHYLSEWEDTETGERSKDSLHTLVWTTRFTDEMKKIEQEEMQFAKAYLKAVGIEMEDMRDDILGLNWINMFSQMGKKDMESPDAENANIAKEFQKIKGYPVVIDGSYYIIGPRQEEPESAEDDEEETVVDVTDLGSLFGAVTKQVVKSETKKPKEKKNIPAISYYTELIRYESAEVSDNDLKVPAGYEQVEEE